MNQKISLSIFSCLLLSACGPDIPYQKQVEPPIVEVDPPVVEQPSKPLPIVDPPVVEEPNGTKNEDKVLIGGADNGGEPSNQPPPSPPTPEDPAVAIRKQAEQNWIAALAANGGDKNEALMQLIQEDKPDAIGIALAAGANINHQSSHFKHLRPISLAVLKNRQSVANELLRFGPELNFADSIYPPPLALAASNIGTGKNPSSGNHQMMIALKDAGASVNFIFSDLSKKPMNAMLAAIRLHGNPETLELLISLGADINGPKNRSGGPPFDCALHVAIKHDRLEAAQVLLEHGADPYQRDSKGFSAHRLGYEKNARMRKLLERYR